MDIIGVQNNLEVKKIHSSPVSTLDVSKQEYWNTGILEIIFHPIVPLFPGPDPNLHH
jgi:hypothetical protein